MSSYYTGKNARRYNVQWKSYTETTLNHVISAIDFSLLNDVAVQEGRTPRVLDVACGTGILLKRLLERIPTLEAYGVDGSQDMLAQARRALSSYPNVVLEQAEVGAGSNANLPYEAAFFDLITMTNVLHDISKPQETLQQLSKLLATNGQLIVEDYARRTAPFPWKPFEWGIKRIEHEYVKAYTLHEAQQLIEDAGFSGLQGDTFEVDFVFHAWVVQAMRVDD